MKRIYITGICGLLGNNIVKELKEKYIIAGVDLADASLDDCLIERYDIRNAEVLERSIVSFKPDVVIHTAAAINVDKCEEDKEFAYELNAQVTQNISKICQRYNIKLIYISTDAVYGIEKDGLLTEDDITNPINYYGETKLFGEEAVKGVNDSLIIRTNIYGLNIQNKMSFGEWVYFSLKDGKTLNMFTDIYFSPIIVNELANIIDLCIRKNISGIYNICASGKISKYSFGVMLKDIFGMESGNIVPSTSESMHFKARRSKNMGMSNEKITRELHIHISTPEESIKCFKEMLLAKGEK